MFLRCKPWFSQKSNLIIVQVLKFNKMTLLDQMIGGIWTLMRLVPCTDSIPGEYPCNMCKLLNRINDGHSTLHRKDSMCKHLFTTWMAELPSSEKKRVMKIKLNYLKDLNLVCHWICSSNFEWHNIYQLNCSLLATGESHMRCFHFLVFSSNSWDTSHELADLRNVEL